MGKINKNEPYFILTDFKIDIKKRKDGTMADCPMCARNKYLVGYLVYFYNLSIYSAIGHCCAESKNREIAEKDFDKRRRRKYAEEFMLNNIAHFSKCLESIEAILPCAIAAKSLYKRFKSSSTEVWDILSRYIKENNGRLYVVEEVDRTDFLSAGPSGFQGSGRNAVETREINFGYISGNSLFDSKLQIVEELNDIRDFFIKEKLNLDQDQILDHISSLSEDDESLYDLCVKIDKSREKYVKIQKKLQDFSMFFMEDNLYKFKSWILDERNHIGIGMSYRSINKKGVGYSFRNKKSTAVISIYEDSIDQKIFQYDFEWPIQKVENYKNFT